MYQNISRGKSLQNQTNIKSMARMQPPVLILHRRKNDL